MDAEADVGRVTSERAARVPPSSDPGCSPAVIDLRDPPTGAATAPVPTTGALDPLVKALMRAVSLSEVAAAVIAYGTVAVEASWARIVLLDRTGAVAVSLFGGEAIRSGPLNAVGVPSHGPWVDAVRRGVPVEFRSMADVRADYPEMVETHAPPSEGAVITHPLAPAGPCCGAVTFGFAAEGAIAESVRVTVAHVASLTAYAAQRAVVYDAECDSAEMLQRFYLPDRLPDVSGLTFACRCLSASGPWGVAGDWYDVLALPGPLVGLVMGDVAGHGIPAAANMAALRGAVRAFSTVETSPAAILTRMNTYMGIFKPDAFATLLVAVFDSDGGRLSFARAGHPPALLVQADGTSRLLTEPSGPPLGLPGVGYDQGEIAFPPDSTLVIYTDGLIERQDRSMDASMADLVRAALRHRAGPPDHLCERLVGQLAGAALIDDVTLLVARRDGGARSGPIGR